MNYAGFMGVSKQRVAERFKVDTNLVGVMVRDGSLPQPKYKEGKKEYWAISQLPALGRAIEKRLKAQKKAQTAITIEKLTKMLGVSHIAVNHHIRKGHFPEPKELGFGNLKYFTQEQLQQIQKYWKKRNKSKNLVQQVPALRQLGATKTEIQFATWMKLKPKGQSITLNNGRKGKFWKLSQVEELLTMIRAIRKARGLN